MPFLYLPIFALQKKIGLSIMGMCDPSAYFVDHHLKFNIIEESLSIGLDDF
jgi:hypothetical protein